MIVFVRYNLGEEVPLELHEEARVSDLKEAVGTQQGVRPELLRVLFAGRELRSTSTLQESDLPEQSTVHVVLPPSDSSPSLPPSDPQTGGGASDEVPAAGETGSCSSFFVFCKTCRSVQPGKLRVRCKTCRNTTLTLSRGPSCWDDVLLRGRIHGVCQSDGCQGNEAEFYMKCASHPTSDDDLSVALDLIMTNIRSVPCIACTDIMPVVLVFPCSERHVICLPCFRGYCEVRLREGQFVLHAEVGYTLPCAAGCADSLIKELHHFRILGEEQYGRYLQFGAERCLLLIGGLMCPSAGCGAGLVPPPGIKRLQCDPRLGCGFIFCRDCRGGAHEGACPPTQAPPTAADPQVFSVGEGASQRGRWELASLQLLKETTRPCPQCNAPVERDGGCMHMSCPLCSADWCWICRVSWNNDCMGDHWFR
ncbi:hypothetical protein OYC64_012750 [Pagothenia borchgrevinki]|uniref:E3 ubiquitin-protein ligase parkin n=1 Tax=Pagothenia borchgrevinki TaxID=8213 RepID=A0ABD2GAS2_PAGBO